MIKFEEIAPRLAGIRKNRKWLAQQIGQSENTVRQYLGPNGKRSPEFLKKVENVILAEELIQKERQPDAPPWNLIFLTDEQFDRADRASRKKGYLSLKDFCREAILEKADQILSKSKRSIYRIDRPSDDKLPKVAEAEDS